MDQILNILLLVIFTIILNYTFEKFKFNVDLNYSSSHKKFIGKKEIPLTGGILFLISLIIGLSLPVNQIIFLILIFLIGFFSDNLIISSAIKRLALQVIIVVLFVIFLDIKINRTGIIIIDNVIDNYYFKIIFPSLCFLIVINGSNFMDGINTNLIGYYLSVYISLFFLLKNNVHLSLDLEIQKIIIALGILYFFNFLEKLYLGDSGAYLISLFTGYYLIQLANLNITISPFFIALLLWHPSYELLFCIIRKLNLNKSPMLPDKKHLHHVIFLFVKKKTKKFIFPLNYVNTFSGLIISIYNFLLFMIAINYYNNSQIMILLLIFNLLVYSVTYHRLSRLTII